MAQGFMAVSSTLAFSPSTFIPGFLGGSSTQGGGVNEGVVEVEVVVVLNAVVVLDIVDVVVVVVVEVVGKHEEAHTSAKNPLASGVCEVLLNLNKCFLNP